LIAEIVMFDSQGNGRVKKKNVKGESVQPERAPKEADPKNRQRDAVSKNGKRKQAQKLTARGWKKNKKKTGKKRGVKEREGRKAVRVLVLFFQGKTPLRRVVEKQSGWVSIRENVGIRSWKIPEKYRSKACWGGEVV